ncbi:hypothetical protein GCM10009664_55640 [Kitasatospora gansuensis]
MSTNPHYPGSADDLRAPPPVRVIPLRAGFRSGPDHFSDTPSAGVAFCPEPYAFAARRSRVVNIQETVESPTGNGTFLG